MAGGGGGMIRNKVDMRKKIWNSTVILCTVGLCFADTLTIISLKIQGTTYHFKHAGIQTFLLFLGEYCNLIVFAIPMLASKKYLNSHLTSLKMEAIQNKQKLKFTKMWTALPCLLECLSSGMYFTALLLLPASISNMLQGAQIVATCLFSKWINNNPILRHHFLGVSLATIGFFFVGLAGYRGAIGEGADTFDDLHYTTHGYVFGLLCILGNLVFHSLQTNIEEKIMRVNAIPPQRIVGLEGLFGMIWMFAIIMILGFIPCPDEQLCTIGGYYEDIVVGTKQLLRSPGLIFWCFMTILAIFFFNLFGMILIHRVNAVYKVFWDNTLSVFIWAAALAIGYEKFNLEHFSLQATGYCFLIIGNLTYNEVIRWRFWALDRDIFDYEERQSRLSQLKQSRLQARESSKAGEAKKKSLTSGQTMEQGRHTGSAK
jgi:drug/metabolite transporter (DMT)-like permease